MKVLVCSAHPDDETLGAGGTILRHVADGDEVVWCLVTAASGFDWTPEIKRKQKEQVAEAARRAGFSATEWLGFPAAHLDTVSQADINDAVLAVIKRHQPELVYSVWAGDVHRDHQAVAEAVMVATRPYPEQPVRQVLAYETCSSSEWGTEPFPPNVYVDISPYLERKLEVLAAYETEAKTAPHPRSPEGVRARAILRGFEVGLPAAEVFHLIRHII